MCDEFQLADMSTAAVNRRDFTRIGALAALAACAPAGTAQAQAALTERMVVFPAPGGRMDAFFVHPAQGKNPAIIVWPDVAGRRDSFLSMGRRLAREGYAVLVLNPYYRHAEAPQFEDFDDYRSNNGSEKVAQWRPALDAAGVMDTAKAVVAWLDQQDPVDTTKGIGTQGYCMGGPFTVWTAAAVPERVKAAASFHGGGLVGEAETAPVKLLGQTRASYLIAIAKNDDARSPGDKDAFKSAALASGRTAEVEVYEGDHGWTVADSPAYHDDAAEKAWARLLDLYSKALNA